MKICQNCGFHNEDDALFCEECGARLSGAPAGDGMAQGGGENPAQDTAGSWSGQTPSSQSTSRGWTAQSGPGQGSQNWGSQGAPQRPARPPRPPKVRRKPSKFHIAAAVEAVLLAAAVVVFCVMGSVRTSPSRAARSYFQAVMSGDWDQVRALGDLPDSPFLTEESFQRFLEENEGLQGRTVNLVSVDEEEASGGAGSYVRYVDVEYMYQGDPEVYSEQLTLMPSGGREMFFFPDWQVVDGMDFVARDFQVEVPLGSTLVVDGLVVDDSLLTERYNATDLYTLDLFIGSHEITVVTGLGPQTATYELWGSGDYYYAGDLAAMTENVQNQLVTQTKTLLEQLFTAALANSDFSALSGSYSDEMLNGQLPELYAELREDFFEDENWRALGITLDNFSVWDCSAYYSEDGQLMASLDLEFDCAIEYARLENSYLDSTDSYTDYGEIILDFVYQDGTWIPYDVWSLDW